MALPLGARLRCLELVRLVLQVRDFAPHLAHFTLQHPLMSPAHVTQEGARPHLTHMLQIGARPHLTHMLQIYPSIDADSST